MRRLRDYLTWALEKLSSYLTTVWGLIQGAIYKDQKKNSQRSWRLSEEEIGYIRHRTSRSPIRRHLRPSALNPLSPMDPDFDSSTISADKRRSTTTLLPPTVKSHPRKKKTLVLDLDETLIHASLQSIPTCEFIT